MTSEWDVFVFRFLADLADQWPSCGPLVALLWPSCGPLVALLWPSG